MTILKGTDVEGVALAAQSARANVRATGRVTIAMVARMDDAKDHGTVLRAVADLMRSGLTVAVRFAGGGRDRECLEGMAEESGVKQRLTFSGNLCDVRPAYPAMDAFGYLALYDSFGLATAEAKLCRVPVFGIHGPGEYNEPENPLVTPDNAAFASTPRSRLKLAEEEEPRTLIEIARRINDFGRDPASLNSVVQRARHHVSRNFTTDIHADAMLALYQSMLTERG